MSKTFALLASEAAARHRLKEEIETLRQENERLERLVVLQREVGAQMARGWNECWAELRRLQALRTEEVAREP